MKFIHKLIDRIISRRLFFGGGKFGLPGDEILKLSDEEKAKLKDLKSSDLNVRDDVISSMIECLNNANKSKKLTDKSFENYIKQAKKRLLPKLNDPNLRVEDLSEYDQILLRRILENNEHS